MSDEGDEHSSPFRNTLSHIIYSSVASGEFDAAQLPLLLDQARRNNARLSVTGLLLFSNGNFFQVLEGEQDTLNDLYGRIRRDSRHSDIVTIVNEPIARRSFSEWNLKFPDIHSADLQGMDEDLRAFVQGHKPLVEIGRGRASKLIEAFEAGHWHRSSDSAPQGESIQAYDSFSMAFQPIVDMEARDIFSHEALVRGPGGEPAYTVLEPLTPDQAVDFDVRARNLAVRLAADLKLETCLNLNFIPSAAIGSDTNLDRTLEVARQVGFPEQNIIFEATETEFIKDLKRFSGIVKAGQRFGFELAIDDFGSGHSGLSMLAEFQPDYVKLDMGLVRDVHSHGPRQAIARAITGMCEELGIELVVEGIETMSEYRWFRNQGVRLFQGYLFAKPMFEGRPLVRFPPAE